MLTAAASPLLPLVTFGLATLLVGGFVGGEMTRRSYIKEDIKAIQQEHGKTLARMDSVLQRAKRNEEATLAQMDSVYVILGQLNAQENKARTNIGATTNRLNQMKKSAEELKKEISDAAADSDITLKKKSAH